MEISEGARNIRNIIIEGTERSLTTSINDTTVIERSGLPAEEVYKYLSHLERIGHISISRKMSGADFRPILMTKECFQASSENQALR
jgi:hypothetical protein